MNKEPYLIAIDLDGTLIDDKKDISPNTFKILKELIKKGHHVILASGRPYKAILPYKEKLGLKTPTIAYNGAAIIDDSDVFTTFTYHYDRNVIINIVHDLKDEIKNVLLETLDEIWMLKEDEDILKTFFHEGVKTHFGPLEKILDKDPITFIIEPNTPSYNDKINRRINEEKYLRCRFWSFLPFDEVYDVRVDKSIALKKIAAHLKVKKDHIIAFGDMDNDFKMLKFAKFGFMMKGSDLAKTKPRGVLLSEESYDKEGIYLTLKKLEYLF